MGRALSLFLLALLLPKALGQSVNCDATDLVYDFSAPGSLTQVTVAGQPYYVANQASYLLLLEGTGPMRFLPTAVTGGTGYRMACTVRTPNRDAIRGGALCGGGEEVLLAGDGRFRFSPRGLDLEALRPGPGSLGDRHELRGQVAIFVGFSSAAQSGLMSR
jgi:hypothetical protein